MRHATRLGWTHAALPLCLIVGCSGETPPTPATTAAAPASSATTAPASSAPLASQAANSSAAGATVAGAQRLVDTTFDGVAFDVEIRVTEVEEVSGVEDVPESARVLRLYYEVVNHGAEPLDEDNAYILNGELATAPANEAVPLILLDFSGADCPTLGIPPVAPGATGLACDVFQVPRDASILGFDFEVIGGEAGTVRVAVPAI